MTKFDPVLLILEDETQSQELLQTAFLAEGIKLDNLFVASTVKQAQILLRDQHFHGISIDQNMPMDEHGAVTADHGLAFTELNRWPLAKRVVYTAKGQVAYANRVGLAGAEYREKSEISDAGSHRSLYDYSSEFMLDLKENYVEKSLRAASSLLPYSLSFPALKAADAKQAGNWPEFFRQFSDLRERLMRLTLAVTLAAKGRKQPWRDGMRPQEIEEGLREYWRPPPATIRRYIAMPGWEPGEALYDSSADLRKLRNSIEHHDRQNYVAADFAEQHGNVVAIIDLLALFCEVPIMHSPRFHPTKRGLISFHRMGPNKGRVEGIWDSDFDPPPFDDAALYMPWRGPQGPELLNLAPWLIARRDAVRELEFLVMLGQKSEIL